MQEEHRKAIQKIYSSLVEQTDLDWMVSALYEKGIFSEQMIEPYKDTNRDVRYRKQQLYMDITRRGPRAFPALVDALTEVGHWHLVRELDPHSAYNLPARAPSPRLTGSKDKFVSISKNPKPPQVQIPRNVIEPNTSLPPEKTPAADTALAPEQIEPPFKVIKSTKFYDGDTKSCYRTRGPARGVMLLFSYEQFAADIADERRGADLDCAHLKYLFTEMGFNGCMYRNLTEKETLATLEQSRSVVRGAEVVFVVVSSHGYARHRSADVDIRCSDGRLLSFMTIIDYFNNTNAPHLVGVPKVFIFQVCRGNKMDYGWVTTTDLDADTAKTKQGDEVVENNEEKLKHRGSPETGDKRETEGAPPVATDGASFQEAAASRGFPRLTKSRMHSDILIGHSTVPGYVSHRDPGSGSLYLQALCQVFAAHAHDQPVQWLLAAVDERLGASSLAAQTSSADYWGFNKLLYLHPGLVEHPTPTPPDETTT